MISAFLLGWSIREYTNQEITPTQETLSSLATVRELASPADWIEESKIRLTQDGVFISINDPRWAVFTDTNSMDPVIDTGMHAIEIVPTKPEQINVGDIVSYEDERGIIVHRVVEVGTDEKGWYARFKGDNNAFIDPEKVRWEQIRRVVVGVIY